MITFRNPHILVHVLLSVIITSLLPLFPAYAQGAATTSAVTTSNCLTATGQRLSMGMTSPEVLLLQKTLNTDPANRVAFSGVGSPGLESNYFGAKTKLAVMAFQNKYRAQVLTPSGLTLASGSVGPFTRVALNTVCLAAKGEVKGAATTKKKKTRRSGGGGGGSATRPNPETPVAAPVAHIPTSTKATSSSVVVTPKPPVVVTPKPVPVVKPPTTPPPAPTPTTTVPVKPPVVVPPPVVTPPPPPTPSTNTKLEWGASAGFGTTELATFESLVGKPVQIKSIFTNWNQAFPIYATPGLAAANKTLLIFWEQNGVTLDDIIAGRSDAYIREFAAAARAYEGKIILAPLHEMNGDWDPWDGSVNGNTPAKVVAAWRHIHDVFGTDTDIKYAWTVNRMSVPNTPENAIPNYYPGASYTDYVAVDGFNFGTPWRSFTETFQEPLKLLAGYGKPIYILSLASAEGPQKAAWIKDFGARLKEYPLLKGWVWFNQNKEHDWRVNSDPASLEAFRALLI